MHGGVEEGKGTECRRQHIGEEYEILVQQKQFHFCVNRYVHVVTALLEKCFVYILPSIMYQLNTHTTPQGAFNHLHQHEHCCGFPKAGAQIYLLLHTPI